MVHNAIDSEEVDNDMYNELAKSHNQCSYVLFDAFTFTGNS